MFLKRIRESETIPFGYRVAYRSVFPDHVVVCAPIGLHLFVRVLFHAWLFSLRCSVSKWETYLEETHLRGYQEGWKQGFEQGSKRLRIKREVVEELVSSTVHAGHQSLVNERKKVESGKPRPNTT